MNTKILAAMALSMTLVVGLLAGCGGETVAGGTETNDAVETGTQSEKHEVVLSVPDMNCPMCPITVRQALAGVDGVYEADASLAGKEARVVFDPARTDTEALIAAVAETGFSARLKEPHDE